ncbi:MAG: 4Fe-4S dicluster domain-containing protein [Chloroflexi bacterium]|nr:4Fe-4S dicluster domain-containing protein [Chloroflexota bacterium]
MSGRIIGPTTFQVKKLYEKAGVMLNSAELPDHAALEISFLAYLAEQESLSGADAEDWRAVREAFVEKHAGRWLPTIGGQLLRSPYPAWAAVGYILDACFAEEKPIPKICPVQTGSPMIIRAEDCTLCGFCVQTCPEKALKIHEDEHTTALWLLAEHCTQCRKCGQVCDQKALSYEIRKLPAAALLRQSHRATCPACSAQTVSQAEINAIATRLGEHPRWLDYCLDCRPKLLEMN